MDVDHAPDGKHCVTKIPLIAIPAKRSDSILGSQFNIPRSFGRRLMRNIREEAEALLGQSDAVLPEEVRAAAAAYASQKNYAWWESAFLLDELEKLTGVVLHNPRNRAKMG